MAPTMPGTDSYRVFLVAKERRELFAPFNGQRNGPGPKRLPRNRYLEEAAER